MAQNIDAAASESFDHRQKVIKIDKFDIVSGQPDSLEFRHHDQLQCIALKHRHR